MSNEYYRVGQAIGNAFSGMFGEASTAPTPNQGAAPRRPRTNIDYVMGPRRPDPPSELIIGPLATAAEQVLGPGATIRVKSGVGPHGSPRHRDAEGYAADVEILRPDGTLVTLDDPEAELIAYAAVDNGVTGVGAGTEYMGNSTFHFDVFPQDRYSSGMDNAWGSWGNARQDEIVRRIGARGDAAPAQADPFGLAAIEQEYNLPPGYLTTTAQIESSMDPNAQNPNSSAAGLFQFIDSTAQQYGLADPLDPVASARAAAELASDNRDGLRSVLGREPTAEELYLAHQQGLGGATALLRDPDALATAALGNPDAVTLNMGDENMTAGQFADTVMGYYRQGAGTAPNSGGVDRTGDGVTPRGQLAFNTAQEPIQDFTETGEAVDPPLLGILRDNAIIASEESEAEAARVQRAELQAARGRAAAARAAQAPLIELAGVRTSNVI